VSRQLLLERAQHEKLMVQMLDLTNDLNRKEDENALIKKKVQRNVLVQNTNPGCCEESLTPL
jgi:hypothetical protein